MKTKLIIFGITGDLSRRKLLPALEHIFDANDSFDLEVIGVSRRSVDINELLEQSIGRADIAGRMSMYTMDLDNPADYEDLKAFLDLNEQQQALFYLSVPPSAATSIVDFLGQAGLNSSNVKLLFEKPFGFDYQSAKEYIERTARYYTDDQIYRIDHYMAKDIAQTLMQACIECHWGSETVASIEVTATETIGIEGRAFFYEQTGALRDFLQGHLLQLLSLVLADPTADMPLSERRQGALEQLIPANPDYAVRAQYDGYGQEVNNPGSLTETFAAVSIASNDPRWRGVPISLVTGKSMDKKRSYVRIKYKNGDEHIYEEGIIQTEATPTMGAYERVLIEAMDGRQDIFTTGREVLRSWQLVGDVQRHWSLDNSPLPLYRAGATIDEVLSLSGQHHPATS